jgi:hypothetical protein
VLAGGSVRLTGGSNIDFSLCHRSRLDLAGTACAVTAESGCDPPFIDMQTDRASCYYLVLA